jgi:ribosome-binding ATPase YchF (GTP1/OBG family)
MKVATFELDIAPGKYKYSCEYFTKLVKKFSPKKETPYTLEFIGTDYTKADAIVFNSNKKLDFIFIDLEKIENRILRVADAKEREFLARLQSILEKETLLCDSSFSEEEKALLKNLAPVSYKPCLEKAEVTEMNTLIGEILERSGTILFFTAAEKEVRAWELKKGSSIVEAAGKIHTDLARGFIKAEVVGSSQLDNFHNLAEARAKGLVKTVDRNYIVQDADIIEIKFSI